MNTRQVVPELLYETDPVTPALEEADMAEEGSSGIWRNLERCGICGNVEFTRSGALKTLYDAR